MEPIPGIVDYSDLLITFNTNQFDPDAVVAAVKQAMERRPDPRHPGPVEVIWKEAPQP